MKTMRKICKTIVVIIVLGLMTACSSDDDENGNGTVAGKRLAKLEMKTEWWNQTMTYSYTSDGEISGIHLLDEGYRETYTEDISFIISESVVSWSYKSSDGDRYGYRATLENGRARSMTLKDCIFRYDGSGKLIEVECRGWDCFFELIWKNGNITRLDRVDYKGDLEARIDYTYTTHEAGMLAYEFGFNPLSENDFLDCVYERALFYSGVCGVLSKNLPATATFYDSNGENRGTRKYEYRTSACRVTSVVLGGHHDDDSYSYPLAMTFTWE